MHELAVVEALVGLVEERARGAPVAEVRIRVGALTGIASASLALFYEGLTAGGRLEGSRLVCEPVPARLRCGSCDAEYEPEGFARVCRACGALGASVVRGLELDLVEITARSEAHV